MGSTMSSEGLPEAIAVKFVELGDLFCTAGDNEIGTLLKEICRSPDHILSLRNALLQTVSSSRASSTTSPDSLWLQKFVSRTGESLTDTQQARLSRLFGRWAHGTEVDKVEVDALNWCRNPSLFCETAARVDTSSRKELVGVYFDEYEWIENAPIRNRPRRRVILLETFLVIQQEEQRLRRANKVRRRQVSTRKVSENPSAPFRTRAVKSIADRLWSRRFSPEEIRSREKRLMRMTRYGEKWSLIEPRCLLLGLAGESQEFEQQKWSNSEIQAMNEHVKNMPIYSIRATLENAMAAVTKEWSRQVQDHQVDSCLAEAMNVPPTHEMPHISSAKPPDNGMQMLLNALLAEGGALNSGTNTLSSDLQSLGNQQSYGMQLPSILEGSSMSGEDVDRLYRMSDFEVVSSPFIDFTQIGI